MNISSNISSIAAHQSMMNANANNIANANSERFIPTDTTITNSGSSVVAEHSKAQDNNSLQSQTNLTKEIVNQITIEKATEANVKAIRTQDDILGSLLDIKA